MCGTIGRCGFKCHLCPVYTPNIRDEADRVEISKKWKQFYSYDVEPDSLKCDGCIQNTKTQGARLHPNCEFMKCAEDRSLNFCQDCRDYPCKPLDQYFIEYEEVAKELSDTISKEEYKRHFEPYIRNK